MRSTTGNPIVGRESEVAFLRLINPYLQHPILGREEERTAIRAAKQELTRWKKLRAKLTESGHEEHDIAASIAFRDEFVGQAMGRLREERIERDQKRLANKRVRAERPNDRMLAIEYILSHNYKIILKVANSYRIWGARRGCTLADLFTIALDGFVHSIVKFDLKRNVRLSTYAVRWMRAALGRALTGQGRLIHVPYNVELAVNAVIRAHDMFVTTQGHEPDDEELLVAVMKDINAQRAKKHEETAARAKFRGEKRPLKPKRASEVEAMAKIAEFRERLDDPTPIHQPIGDGNLQIGDTLADHNRDAEAIVRAAEANEITTLVRAAISTLPPLEQEIIRLRYLYERPGRNNLTLEEVGDTISPEMFANGDGVSRERVRQLQSDAFKRLRKILSHAA